jgi:hypothetical protein
MFKDGVEQVTIKCNGGPGPGVRIIPITLICKEWPLPDELPVKCGKYVKIRQSTLPNEAAAHDNVSRGAEYDWKED